jgi:hypothetical protein
LRDRPRRYLLVSVGTIFRTDKIQGVLTPKFGKESDLWVRFDEESVWWKEGYFQKIFGKEICGRLFAPVRQRNSRADFAGLDGDVAQSGETNGWTGDRA